MEEFKEIDNFYLAKEIMNLLKANGYNITNDDCDLSAEFELKIGKSLRFSINVSQY